jgi:hypothetical protein
VQGSQIDVRGRVLGLKLEYFLIGSQCFSLRGGIFFQAASFSCDPGSRVGMGVLVKTFSRDVKSITNCPAIGSSSRPSCRKATRRLLVEEAPASSKGFPMPDACFRIASSDCLITAGRTRMAHRSRTFFTFSRSEKE